MSPVEVIAERIGRLGPRPLSEVLDVALYEPGAGFYDAGGAAGRRDGDFLTSPEVGPLFGTVVARALDGWWHEMGEPDPYLVVEAGAGPGTLAQAVLHASPECAAALRYVLVERSSAQRRRQGTKVPIEEPALVLPPLDADTGEPVPEAPRGPLLTSLADLPRVPGVAAVVLANELLDNLPFDLAERRGGAWLEIRVGLGFREVTVPLDDSRADVLDRLAPDAPEGARVPLQAAAAEWLRSALATAGTKGRVVAFDYATTTADLASRPMDEWLRTYRAHARGAAYLDALGTQDVTCEVAVDQLAIVRPPASDTAQADWLRHWSVDALVAEGQRVWSENAHAPTVATIAARSRTPESHALLDPKGLGAFRVLEWTT